MKQDYGMFFFACLFKLMPDHHLLSDYALFCCGTLISLICSQLQDVWCQDICPLSNPPVSNNIQIVISISQSYASHHEAILNRFVSVPADLFISLPGQTDRGFFFSIITWNDVDSARVCFSITCYNCWWSVS